MDFKEGEKIGFDKIFEEKFKAFLFPEPYFSEFLHEIEDKIRPVATNWTKDEVGKYVRYLKVANRGVSTTVVQKQLEKLKENHSRKLVKFLREIFKSNPKFYCDFELHVENEIFYCHRLLVACFIPFIFHKLSKSSLKMDETRRIKLKGISAKTFKIILYYIYNGYCEPSEEDFLPVLDTAIRFFMYEFADTWIEMYEERFATRSEQLLFRCKMARRYKWNTYVTRLNRILALELENLIISNKFFTLTHQEFKDLIKEDEVGVQSEVVIFLALLKWLKYDWESRKKYAVELFSEIRFPYMTKQELFACFTPPLLKEAVELPQVKAMITDSINFQITIQQMKGKKIPVPGNHKKRTYRVFSPTPLTLWTVDDSETEFISKTKVSQVKTENAKVEPVLKPTTLPFTMTKSDTASTPTPYLVEPATLPTLTLAPSPLTPPPTATPTTKPTTPALIIPTLSSSPPSSSPSFSETSVTPVTQTLTPLIFKPSVQGAKNLEETKFLGETLKVKSDVKEPTHRMFYEQAEKLRKTFLDEESEVVQEIEKPKFYPKIEKEDTIEELNSYQNPLKEESMIHKTQPFSIQSREKTLKELETDEKEPKLVTKKKKSKERKSLEGIPKKICSCELDECKICKAKKISKDSKEKIRGKSSEGIEKKHRHGSKERRLSVDEIQSRESIKSREKLKDGETSDKDQKKNKEKEKKISSHKPKIHEKEKVKHGTEKKDRQKSPHRPSSKRRDSQKFKTTDLQKLSLSRSKSSSGSNHSLESREDITKTKPDTSLNKKTTKGWKSWF